MVVYRYKLPFFALCLLVNIALECFDCLAINFVQNGRKAILNYTRAGISLSVDDKAKCMPDIGCFSAGEPFFHPVHRPFSVLPQNRDEIGTAFLLYTRKNPLFFQFLQAGNIDSVLASSFLLETETKIIVPGWRESFKVSNWMEDMKDAFLNYDDCNVIIVDWTKSNGIPFVIAVANTRVVGAELALLVNFLQDSFGVEPETLHMIGHNLGAEIAGYAGERINRLGRITALDPAGLHFRFMDLQVRLDPTDALFVDAIHAHSSDINIDKPSRLQQTGHIDFYPNGGENQPACSSAIKDAFVKRGVSVGSRRPVQECESQKAIEFFMATIPNHYGCQPVSVACDSWEHFTAGKCSDCAADGSQCVVMGFEADEKAALIKQHPPRKYYLYTDNNPPFCVQQYHVSVKLTNSPLIHKTVGEIIVTLRGRYGSLSVDINKGGIIRGGTVYKTVAYSSEDIDVQDLTFHWKCATLKLSEKIRVNLDVDGCKLFLHSVIVTSFTTSQINPGKQVVICGPFTPLMPNLDLHLKPDTHCIEELH